MFVSDTFIYQTKFRLKMHKCLPYIVLQIFKIIILIAAALSVTDIPRIYRLILD